MDITNLTPHNINIVDGPTIPRSGRVARVEVRYLDAGSIDNIPLFGAEYGEVQLKEEPCCASPTEDAGAGPDRWDYCAHCGEVLRWGIPGPLPDEMQGRYYIVSSMVAAARPDRSDLLTPGDLVRDDTGRVIGCRGLVIA